MKDDIRKKYFNIRECEKRDSVIEKSGVICKKLAELQEFSAARTIMCYVSTKNEVITHGIIRKALESKKVSVPAEENGRISISLIRSFDDLKPSRFGILEPENKNIIDAGKIDLFIVPGIAFDRNGSRIGYGMGYFDRFLSEASSPIIALAFDFQLTEHIESEPNDIKMHKIITEKEIINCRGRK